MREENDVFAQVGIGAMIVFIGCLLAVISSSYVMLNQLERISEATEETIAVATNEAYTQIIFVGGWIDDDYDDYLFMIEYQSRLFSHVAIGTVKDSRVTLSSTCIKQTEEER